MPVNAAEFQSRESWAEDPTGYSARAEHFRILADNIDQLAWIANKEGWVVWYNRRWYDYTGTTFEEMQGWGWMKVHHPDHVDSVVHRVRHSWDTGEVWEDTFPLRGRDGDYRWFLSRAAPIRDEAGEIVCWFGTNTDITEHRDNEVALRRSRERLHMVLGSAGMSVWEIDIESGTHTWDDQFAKLVGVAPEQAEEACRNWLEFVHPDDRQELVAAIQAAIQRETDRIDTDFRVIRSDGEIRWFADFGIVKHDEDRGVFISGLVMDITRRKEAEEERRVAEEQLRLAQATAKVGTFEFNLQTGVNRWSPEIEALYGLEPGTFKGTHEAWKELIHPEDLPEADRNLMSALERGEFQGEWRAIWPDGSEHWLAARARVFYDGFGKPWRMVGANMDISDRKKSERELTLANEELERRVAQRTSELEERARQLSRLTSELTLAEQRERRHLSTILHDHLQQLLVGAKISLQVVEQSCGQDEKDAIRRVDDFIEEAIKSSRSLTFELATPILYESGLAAALEWLAQWKSERHGIVVHTNLDHEVACDRDDVRTLVYRSVRELLLNVVKHSGVMEATIEMKKRDDEFFQVSVSDPGKGFDPARILETASRADQGFGLFSIRERMSLIGGVLEIESSEGNGARFTLVAPSQGDSISGTHPDQNPEATQRILPMTLSEERFAPEPEENGKVRLLLADDHEMLCHAMAILLDSNDDIVVVGQAANGLEALELARRIRPDVILMDASMPKMDGVEATRRLREEMPDVRVIGLSMFDEVESARAMLEAGAIDYLTKGVNPEVLLTTIRRICRQIGDEKRGGVN